MTKREVLDTHQKALHINLDPSKYGTFAEIGAGQEVARWFFRVGGAAGTIAKSISAYDMTISDAIYGPAERYVTRQRLQAIIYFGVVAIGNRVNEPGQIFFSGKRIWRQLMEVECLVTIKELIDKGLDLGRGDDHAQIL